MPSQQSVRSVLRVAVFLCGCLLLAAVEGLAFDQEAAREALSVALQGHAGVLDDVIVESGDPATSDRYWMVRLETRSTGQFKLTHHCSFRDEPGSTRETTYRFEVIPIDTYLERFFSFAGSASRRIPDIDWVIVVFDASRVLSNHGFSFELADLEQGGIPSHRQLYTKVEVAVANPLEGFLETRSSRAVGVMRATGETHLKNVGVSFDARAPVSVNLCVDVEGGSSRAENVTPLVIVDNEVAVNSIVPSAHVVETRPDRPTASSRFWNFNRGATVIRVGELLMVHAGFGSNDTPDDEFRIVITDQPFKPHSDPIDDLIPWKNY